MRSEKILSHNTKPPVYRNPLSVGLYAFCMEYLDNMQFKLHTNSVVLLVASLQAKLLQREDETLLYKELIALI